jgi:hypothetical protein
MKPAELEELIAELRSSPVCNAETFCKATGSGRTAVYEQLRTTGELAGIRAIRVSRKWVIPTRPILELLGYSEEPHSYAHHKIGGE